MLTHLLSLPIKFHQNWCSTTWSSTIRKSSQFCKLPISKYYPIETYLVEIVKFGWNCEVWLKLCNLVEIVKLVDILKFGGNCEIWWELWNLVKIVKFFGKCEIRWKLWNLVEIVKFGWKCEIWLKMWNFVDIVKFGENCEIWWTLWKKGTISTK